jgi:HK97 family phage major capsid protein
MNSAIVLRKIGGKFDAFFRTGYHLVGAPRAGSASIGAGFGMLSAVAMFALAILPALLFLIGTALALHFASGHGALSLAYVVPATAPAAIKQKANAHTALLKELEQAQNDMASGKKLDQNAGEAIDKKANEAQELQAELDQWKRLNNLTAPLRAVDNPALPGESKELTSPDDVVAYYTLGRAFVESDGYKQFAKNGFPAAREMVAPFEGASFHDRKSGFGVVPITRKMISEGKAVPTVGAGVIRATREPDVVRYQERDRLSVRDLVNVSGTDSNSIEYVTISGFTRAAAPVADSAVKPEAALTFGSANAPVRTIAVTMPVTEQQLQDVPQLQNTIDVELTWDLKKTEEEQILWGSGVGQNLLGVFNTPGVSANRVVAGDTLIDVARRMITDVIVAGLNPNGIVIDPLDWETILLTKGTTGEYIWVVVTGDNGSRLWATNVVETTAAREPGTFTTNERRMLVGDFVRGATLWDRQQAGMQIGWVNDQFVRNQRTIRVEERLAFGVKRPAAFRYKITQARVP